MKNTVQKLFTLFALAVLPLAQAHAAGGLLSLEIEPLVGYERVQKVVPDPHTKERLFYGARVTAGIPLVAAEAEYTRGTDTESFTTQSLTVKDTDDKLKVGLRSGFSLTSLLQLYARGGVQAKRNTHEETLNGATTTTVGAIVYKPYAGVSLRSRLAGNFDMNGGITVVFNQFPDMAQNEYQASLGFTVHFP